MSTLQMVTRLVRVFKSVRTWEQFYVARKYRWQAEQQDSRVELYADAIDDAKDKAVNRCNQESNLGYLSKIIKE